MLRPSGHTITIGGADTNLEPIADNSRKITENIGVKSRWQSALAGALVLTIFPVITPVDFPAEHHFFTSNSSHTSNRSNNSNSSNTSNSSHNQRTLNPESELLVKQVLGWQKLGWQKLGWQLQSAKAESEGFDAIGALEQLPVKGRAPKTGYSRNQFGSQWTDIDRNGCDTRNDILKRDLTSVVFKEKTRNCVVESGILNDSYSGQIIAFQRGEKTSALIQIDHIVALSNAWQTGIFQSSLKERTNFANDPLNLMAVKGSLNSQKGDGDAATWLPPNKSYRCEYVSRQIQVKVKYRLWVTKPEKEAMLRVLQSPACTSNSTN